MKARRKSMAAADSESDLHGHKEGPGKEGRLTRRRSKAALGAAVATSRRRGSQSVAV